MDKWSGLTAKAFVGVSLGLAASSASAQQLAQKGASDPQYDKPAVGPPPVICGIKKGDPGYPDEGYRKRDALQDRLTFLPRPITDEGKFTLGDVKRLADELAGAMLNDRKALPEQIMAPSLYYGGGSGEEQPYNVLLQVADPRPAGENPKNPTSCRGVRFGEETDQCKIAWKAPKTFCPTGQTNDGGHPIWAPRPN